MTDFMLRNRGKIFAAIVLVIVITTLFLIISEARADDVNDVPYLTEIGWAGTPHSSFDEWIEINPGDRDVRLEGWTLTFFREDGSDSQIIMGDFVLEADRLHILERTDDTALSIPASGFFTGGIPNTGIIRMEWADPDGRVVQSIDLPGGVWPAGDSDIRSSMQIMVSDGRMGYLDGLAVTGVTDAGGNLVLGTPGQWSSEDVGTLCNPYTPNQAFTLDIDIVGFDDLSTQWEIQMVETLYSPVLEPVNVRTDYRYAMDGWTIVHPDNLDDLSTECQMAHDELMSAIASRLHGTNAGDGFIDPEKLAWIDTARTVSGVGNGYCNFIPVAVTD